jgi:hypothetical protein
MLNRTFNENVPRNTLHYWTSHYSDIFTYLRIRKRNEPRLPLMPRKYLKHTFSLHRTKVTRLPENMDPLSNFIYKAYKGIDPSNLSGKTMGSETNSISSELLSKREFKEKNPITRIIRIAEENDEPDPIRLVLINDDISLCRNLPLYYLSNTKDCHYGFLDLLQYDDGKIICLAYRRNFISEIETLKFLVESGHSIVQRTGIGFDRVRIGAFDAEKIWYMDLPTSM